MYLCEQPAFVSDRATLGSVVLWFDLQGPFDKISFPFPFIVSASNSIGWLTYARVSSNMQAKAEINQYLIFNQTTICLKKASKNNAKIPTYDHHFREIPIRDTIILLFPVRTRIMSGRTDEWDQTEQGIKCCEGQAGGREQTSNVNYISCVMYSSGTDK